MCLPTIYKTEKEILPGPVYVKFTCGCIFLDTEDQKRKKRSLFEIRNGKRTNRVFCPNHKKDSFVKQRMKICPVCNELIVASKNTTPGLCRKCLNHVEARKSKKVKIKNCIQYGKPYELRKNEKIISKHMCRNREYCLSFIKKHATLMQCANCPHLKDNIFGD
jgi:hypothetical protein